MTDALQIALRNVGRRVRKTSGLKTDGSPKEPKPFKSGRKVNTIKGVIEHPIVGGPAYTFEEDESYVATRSCTVLDEGNNEEMDQ